jgi:hemerythrin-like domain-containing protein
MGQISEEIHHHHQEILNTLTQHVTALIEERPTADPDGLVRFLHGDLMPHAEGEERYMYPALDPVLRAHGRPTATMTVDHEFIAGYIRRIAETAQALRAAAADDRPALLAHLRRLSLQLEALLTVHLEKEERVYLPLFEQYLPEAEQQRILDGMHEASPAAPEGAEVV